MDLHTRQGHRRKFHHRRMHTCHRATPQIIILHKFIRPMAITTSDSSERLNKITRITTMINIATTMRRPIIHPTLAHRPAQVAVKTFIFLRCLSLPRKRLARRRAWVTRRSRHCRYLQTPVIMRLQRLRQRRKARRVADDSKTPVPRDQRWTIHPRPRTLSRRKECSFGISMRQSSFFIRSWREHIPIAIIRYELLISSWFAEVLNEWFN